MLFASIVFVALYAIATAIQHQDIILEPVSNEGKEVCVLLMQGAEITPEQYVPLMKEVQQQSSKELKLWVGIPQFPGDMAFEIDRGVTRILDELKEKGMNTDVIMVAGHSLGGAMVQNWSAKNADKIVGQVLMGSFLTHSWKNNYIFSYNVPTLTIGGELDGLARVTRISEAFYTQILDPAVSSSDSTAKLLSSPNGDAVNTSFPVTIIEGITHMQFADGEPPSLVFKRDLLPEKTYPEAHALIAQDFVAFMYTAVFVEGENPGASQQGAATMQRRLTETNTFAAPILDALHLEGYHNFRPPCLCETDICAPQDDCTARCPWTTKISQPTMGSGSGLDAVTINNTDSFHDVWETKPTVHLPKVLNTCDAPDSTCQLDTTTVTQGAYHSGEDLEIWKIHFDVPSIDSGFLPLSAFELKTKMSSRQRLYTAAGIPEEDADWESLDGGKNLCGEINQKALDWAAGAAATATMDRYETYGQMYTIGADVEVCPAGPCWIWKELQFDEAADKNTVEVRSPFMTTPVDYPIKSAAGFHYCKVLSPARVMEWMYVDSLRAKYSLHSHNQTLH